MFSFKQFIAESENPVVVKGYHGAGRFFHKFDQSKARIKDDFMGGGIAYITDHKPISHNYAKSAAKETKTPYVYHVTAKMDNVFDVDHEFTGEKLKRLLPKDTEKFASSAGLIGLHNHEHKHRILSDLESGKLTLKGHQVFAGLSHGGTKTANARKHLIKKGYDGLRYNGGVNMNQATKHNVFIPYKDEAINIDHVEKL